MQDAVPFLLDWANSRASFKHLQWMASLGYD